MADLEFSNLSGETLTKLPGTINGESFKIENLQDCSVYLLDYTSEVEVNGCSNCRIFIGPVDGPAIFESCTDCHVAVACQQFQAKNCRNIECGLYCATQPSIAGSSEIRIGCWAGAYPDLTAHFQAANLDPKTNSWDKVYDGSAEDSFGTPNFELIEPGGYWEVPIEGGGQLENPVPLPDGTAYHPTAAAAAAPPAAAAPAKAPAMANGSAAPSAPLPASGFQEENPKVVAMREKMRERLAKQEESERSTKSELATKAATYLEGFYERRNTQKDQRSKTNREQESLMSVSGPEGDTEWERAINLINFGFSRPNGADISRLKTVLFNAKSKNVPIKGETLAQATEPAGVVGMARNALGF